MPMSLEVLREEIEKRVRLGKGAEVLQNDSEIIEFMLENCEISIPEANRFFVKADVLDLTLIPIRKRRERFTAALESGDYAYSKEAMAYTGYTDYSHTSAQWESVISLGIFGLRERVAQYAKSNRDEDKRVFYSSVLRCYDAALRFMKRAADEASRCGKFEMAQGIENLCHGAPGCLFEALQTSVIYYTLQQYFDGTNLRTMGRPDKLFYPYYIGEDRQNADGMILDYIKEIDRFGAVANIPFAIGGADAEGRSTINELSYTLLDAYHAADAFDTKLHILCTEDTPRDIILKAFRYVREGKNSIVFMSDSKITESLRKIGADEADARNYHVVGCYECGAEGELTCSTNARVNIPKALELALNRGRDMQTGRLIGLENDGDFDSFEALFLEFERQLTYLSKCAMAVTDYYESHYPEIHSAPFLSGTYRSALEYGRDLYVGYGAKYNNSSVSALGLATVVDSLAAIRKAVFEDKTVSFSELCEILRANWDGKEYLRLIIKNKYPKYGQGDAQTDAIAGRIVDVLAEAVSGQPNAKGGVYRLGLFSIDWRWEFGAKTAASADGRLAGEPLSQNTGASFGADKNGATAHFRSVTAIDASKTPNGSIVDIDLHSSAVSGDNGLAVLATTLATYFEMGGFAVHYNVLDKEILLAAKKNPEKYPGLQVRLCGWNVLFSSLSEREQDEFIARSSR